MAMAQMKLHQADENDGRWSMSERMVLVAGASGVIGGRSLRCGGPAVIGVSRLAPDVAPGTAYEHVPIDLLDAPACRRPPEDQISRQILPKCLPDSW
jgi:nucleoside-diphosphate-sugar epimerase